MLAIGMETVPYVAVGGLFVAGWFLIRGDEASGAAAGFGMAFAATSGAVFVATVPTAEWSAAYCDAYSVAQFAVGALAGAGLAAVASTRALNVTFARRAGSLAALGGAVAAVAVVYFPQCLSGPYAQLGPVLQSYWLDAVDEAQPLLAHFDRRTGNGCRPLRDRTDRAHRAGAAHPQERASPRGCVDRA